MARDLTYSVGVWKSIYTELLIMGMELFGGTCPVSTVIGLALLNFNAYSDTKEMVKIRFNEDPQADLAERVYQDRVKMFLEPNGDCALK